MNTFKEHWRGHVITLLNISTIVIINTRFKDKIHLLNQRNELTVNIAQNLTYYRGSNVFDDKAMLL